MTCRKDVMQCVGNIALEAMNSQDEDQMLAVERWLNNLEMGDFQLDRGQLSKIVWKLSNTISESEESKSGVLDIRNKFYQLTKRVIADTDRMRSDDLLKLKQLMVEIQENQFWLTEQIRKLEEELAENKEQLLGLYQNSWVLLERVMRRDQELIESLHKSKWLSLLRKLCPQMSDQEFNRKVEEVYTDADIANDQLGNALIKKLKLTKKQLPEVINLLETQIDPQEKEFRQSKLAEDLEESQESLSEKKSVRCQVASMSRRLENFRQKFLSNSAELEVGCQRMEELVINLRERISKRELNEADLDPRVAEYLKRVDVELAK